MYDLEDFISIKTHFDNALIGDDGDPLSCKLYSCTYSSRLHQFDCDDGTSDEHCAEACNLADLVSGIRKLLTLPKEDDDCRELSRILIVELDILREHIKHAVIGDRDKLYQDKFYTESEHDKEIKRWAGFIKHPREHIMAHHCVADWGEEHNPPLIIIDTEFLKGWDELGEKKKDARKKDLAKRVVRTQLPDAERIKGFLDSCAAHIQRMIDEELKTSSPVPLDTPELLERPHPRQAKHPQQNRHDTIHVE